MLRRNFFGSLLALVAAPFVSVESPLSERQRRMVTDAYRGEPLRISYNDEAFEIFPDEVRVDGQPGGPWTVTFVGNLS